MVTCVYFVWVSRDSVGREKYHIPKTRVQEWRDVWYRTAYDAARARDPDLNYSDWIRHALDRAAASEIPTEQPEAFEWE